MDADKDGKVGAEDLDATLRSLKHAPGEDDVATMLWEIDDDTKGYLTADDFHTSYYRIRSSTEKDEPRSWFRCAPSDCSDAACQPTRQITDLSAALDTLSPDWWSL